MENKYFEIYQLKDDDNLRYHRFERLDSIHKQGLEVNRDNYEQVYSAENNENLSLEDIYTKFNMERPDNFTGHSLSVSDIVVLKENGQEKAFYCDSFGFTEVPEFLHGENKYMDTELAVKIADRYISIQETEEGYDYTIYGADYKELNGGVYDDHNISIREALGEIIDNLRQPYYNPVNDMYYRTPIQGQIDAVSVMEEIGYEEFLQKAEQAALEQVTVAQQTNRMDISGQKTQEEKNMEVTYTVAECSEFPSLGEYYEHIQTARKALEIYHNMPPERMSGIPSISLNIHEKGTESYMDDQIDLFVNGTVDLNMIQYLPYLETCDYAVEAIAELMYLVPDAEIEGIVPTAVEEKLNEIKEVHRSPIEKLAGEIDQFSYDYDTYAYHDEVENREDHIASIKVSIETGDTGYLKEWMNEIIEENMYADHVSHAKQLLLKLEQIEKVQEYKPLAKVEELEEGNYNKIDGLIDTSEKDNKKENQAKHVRISIREKMAEKKEELEKRKKQKERGYVPEKSNHIKE